MPERVFEVVAREYATRTEIRVFAATSFGSGKITKFVGTNPTAVSLRTEHGTWIIKTSDAAAPVASSMIHSYVVSVAAKGVCHAHVNPAI